MSTASRHHYETCFVLKPSISEVEHKAIQQKVETVISKFNGKLESQDDWGIRELAYPIENDRNGKYHILQYTGDSGVVEEIERHFKISDTVVRYLTVSLPEGYDYSKVKKQILAAEEEIKKARELRKKGNQI